MAETHGQQHDGECESATGPICICACRGTLHGVKHRHGRAAKVSRLSEVRVMKTSRGGQQHEPTSPAGRRRDPVVVTVARVDKPGGTGPDDGPTVTDTVGPTSLPGDLTRMSDDELLQAFSDLADQGRDVDVQRVYDEMGRREAEAAKPPPLPADLTTLGDDDLLAAVSTHAGNETEFQRVWAELSRREDAAAAAEARRAELDTPPTEPAYIESPVRAWADVAGSPIPGYGTADESTRARAQHAMRLAYGLGADTTDAELYGAIQADDRPGDERVGWWFGWYRKLAKLDGIEPGDPRYGPGDSPSAKFVVEGRVAAREQAAREREAKRAAQEARAARLAAGPAGSARVRNPLAAWGDVEQWSHALRDRATGQRARERARLAKIKALGLDEAGDTSDKAIKKAERTDPRSAPQRAAAYLAWYRLIGEADGVQPTDAHRDWELGPVDDRAEPMRTPAIPADVPKAWDRWQEIKLAAKADRDAGGPATWDRYVMAMRHAFGLPDDAADREIVKAHGGDPRKPDEIAQAMIGEYRKLGAAAGIDPNDPLRYGPPDRSGSKRRRVTQWRELTPEDDQRLEALLARGRDYLDAYAEVIDADPEALAAEQALAAIDRKAGETLDKAIRRKYDEWVHLQYLAAEAATAGHMLSRTAEQENARRGRRSAVLIRPVDLFSGPIATARARASEELLRWWKDNERLTYADFRAQILGGRAAKAAKAARAAQSNAKDFV